MFMKMDPKTNKRHDGRHCDLCGCTFPAVRCDKCNSQIFCLSCDDMYHRHPKRRFHLRKAVDPTPTPSARPVLPMKVSNLPVAPGDPSKMPLPPPRKKKTGKSIFDTFRRGSPIETSPNLPKKEYSWSDRLGSIKKFMSQRPLPPVPDNGTEDFTQMNMQPKNDFSFIHSKGEEKPPALPERNQQKSPENPPFQKSFNGNFHGANPSQENGFTHVDGARNVRSASFGQWENNVRQNEIHQSFPQPVESSEYVQGFGTIRRQSQPLRPTSPPNLLADNRQSGMHQSSSATDLHALSTMPQNPGMPSYPHYPYNPHMPPQYQAGYPMYPQYPGYPQYFGNSWANLANPMQNTDGDFSDQSENSPAHLSNMRNNSYKDKKTKRSHSVLVDRMQYPGQFYPYGPYPPGYPPPPWVQGPQPKETPPSPATSLRSLNRLNQSHRKKKVTDEEDDFSSSPLSRPKSSSSEVSKLPRSVRRPSCPSSSSEEEFEKERRRPKASPAMERRQLKQDMLKRRPSSPRRSPASRESPVMGRRQSNEHKKSTKVQQLRATHQEISENSESEPVKTKTKIKDKTVKKPGFPPVDDGKDSKKAENAQWVPPDRWYCKHCTFLNESGERICRVCCKTASNPEHFSSDKQSSVESSASPEKLQVQSDLREDKSSSEKQDIALLNSALDEAEKEINRSLGELLKIKEEPNEQIIQKVKPKEVAPQIETPTPVVSQNFASSPKPTHPEQCVTVPTVSQSPVIMESIPTQTSAENTEQTQYTSANASTSTNDAVQQKELMKDIVQQKELMKDIVQQKELTNVTVQQRELINDTVQQKELVNDTVQQKELINDAVQQKELINDAVQEKKLMTDTVQQKELMNDTVQQKEVLAPIQHSSHSIQTETESAASSNVVEAALQTHRDSFCQTYQDVVLPEFPPEKKVSDQNIVPEEYIRPFDRASTLQSPLPYEAYNPDRRGVNGMFGMHRAHSRASLFGGRLTDNTPAAQEFGGAGFTPSSMYRSLSRSSLLGDAEGWTSEYHSRHKPDFYLSMEELVERRRQETMRAQGLELVRMIREAEQQGFTADDIQVALNNCGKQNPVNWLQDNWKNMIHTVVTLATNYGKDKQENDVGGISQIEARDALRLHKGNIWAAVTECVEGRQRKLLELSARGNFTFNEIVDALTSSDGNVELAYSELTKTTLKPFLMRIWGSGEGAQNLDAANPVPFHYNTENLEYLNGKFSNMVRNDKSDSDEDEVWEEEYEEWDDGAEKQEEEEECRGEEEDIKKNDSSLMPHEDLASNIQEYIDKSNAANSMLTPESDKSEYCDAFSSALSERYLSSTSIDELFLLGVEEEENFEHESDMVLQESKMKGTGFLKKLAHLKKSGTPKSKDSSTLSGLDNLPGENVDETLEDSKLVSSSTSDTKTFSPFGILKQAFSTIKDTVTGTDNNKISPSTISKGRTIIVRDKLGHESTTSTSSEQSASNIASNASLSEENRQSLSPDLSNDPKKSPVVEQREKEGKKSLLSELNNRTKVNVPKTSKMSKDQNSSPPALITSLTSVKSDSMQGEISTATNDSNEETVNAAPVLLPSQKAAVSPSNLKKFPEKPAVSEEQSTGKKFGNTSSVNDVISNSKDNSIAQSSRLNTTSSSSTVTHDRDPTQEFKEKMIKVDEGEKGILDSSSTELSISTGSQDAVISSDNIATVSGSSTNNDNISANGKDDQVKLGIEEKGRNMPIEKSHNFRFKSDVKSKPLTGQSEIQKSVSAELAGHGSQSAVLPLTRDSSTANRVDSPKINPGDVPVSKPSNNKFLDHDINSEASRNSASPDANINSCNKADEPVILNKLNSPSSTPDTTIKSISFKKGSSENIIQFIDNKDVIIHPKLGSVDKVDSQKSNRMLTESATISKSPIKNVKSEVIEKQETIKTDFSKNAAPKEEFIAAKKLDDSSVSNMDSRELVYDNSQAKELSEKPLGPTSSYVGKQLSESEENTDNTMGASELVASREKTPIYGSKNIPKSEIESQPTVATSDVASAVSDFAPIVAAEDTTVSEVFHEHDDVSLDGNTKITLKQVKESRHVTSSSSDEDRKSESIATESLENTSKGTESNFSETAISKNASELHSQASTSAEEEEEAESSKSEESSNSADDTSKKEVLSEDDVSHEGNVVESIGPVRPIGHLRRMSFNTRKEAIFQERNKDTTILNRISENKPWFLQKKIETYKPAPPKRTIKQQLDFERRVRKLVSDKKCRTYRKAEIIIQLMDLKFDEYESIEAANECSTLEQALSFLQQECQLCAGAYPIKEIISMVHCSHKACQECIKAYFTIQIRDRTIMELLCPFCNEPDIADEDVAQNYFNHLDIMLKKLVDDDIHELFQRKLRDRVLMKDPNFRWCTQCSSGFIADPYLKRLMCPDCRAIMCASCRRLWERDHERMSCEEFAAYKDSIDPEQTLGLAKLLIEDGIDCPSCHFKYALAKGGCMHFKCIQCQHDFCSGCSRPFKMGQKCGVSEFCGKLGLHAHHPRNCLFYLRDKDPEDLQKLLDMNDVTYDQDRPASINEKNVCQVMEQKETAHGMMDDICGKEVQDGYAGLCRLHYVEYLGQLVNKFKIDPIQIFENDDLELVLKRASIRLPFKKYRENDDDYRVKLLQVIEDKLPLADAEGS